jgi:hypothetical protein
LRFHCGGPGGAVSDRIDKTKNVRLTDEQRIDCPLIIFVLIDKFPSVLHSMLHSTEN